MALDLSSICHSLRHLHIVSYCICGEFHLMLEIRSHIKYSSLERPPDISPSPAQKRKLISTNTRFISVLDMSILDSLLCLF